MKTIWTLLIAFAFLSACSQEKVTTTTSGINPPDAVKAVFDKQYPAADKAEWARIGDSYEVEFHREGKEVEVRYAATGEVLVLEEEIDASDLPVSLTEAVAASYPEMKIEEADRITRNKEVLYELELTGENIRMEAIFDSNGKMIESEDDDDDDDDDGEDDDDDQ